MQREEVEKFIISVALCKLPWLEVCIWKCNQLRILCQTNKNMANETQNTTEEGLNEPDIVIPVLASNIGFIAALLCFIFGSIINGVAMFVILKSRRVRKHNTTPLLFFQSLNDFGYCFILLPLEAVRLANIYFIQN